MWWSKLKIHTAAHSGYNATKKIVRVCQTREHIPTLVPITRDSLLFTAQQFEKKLGRISLAMLFKSKLPLDSLKILIT
jgi:hypothetical protein